MNYRKIKAFDFRFINSFQNSNQKNQVTKSKNLNMSRRGLEGGRKKSLLYPRRHMKCPVSECKYSGRTDHVKRHFRNLIVWSKTYEGEAAEESENVFISAPRDSKQHTKWCNK